MRYIKLRNLLVGVVLLSVFSGCSSDDPWEKNVTPYKEITLTAQSRAVVEKNNSFGVELYKNIPSGDNFMVSPYGAFSVLAMVANGDNGEARDEITRLLGFGNGTTGVEDMNEYCKMLNQQLTSLDGRVKFKYANSIWSNHELTTSFTDKINDVFDADWFKKNPEESVGEINAWISKSTEGFLTDTYQGGSSVSTLIMNVAYFHGRWSSPFDPSMTKDGYFRDIESNITKVRFMSQTGRYNTVINDEICLVELPYGAGNFSISMIIPSEKSNFETVRKSITPEFFNSLANKNSFTKKDINLSVPKFGFKSKSSIDGALASMGFSRIFEGFDNIFADPAKSFTPKNIEQNSRIELDEEGTKVATSTSLEFVSTNLSVDKIKFDEPFVFFIRETSTNTILFIGEVVRM